MAISVSGIDAKADDFVGHSGQRAPVHAVVRSDLLLQLDCQNAGGGARRHATTPSPCRPRRDGLALVIVLPRWPCTARSSQACPHAGHPHARPTFLRSTFPYGFGPSPAERSECRGSVAACSRQRPRVRPLLGPVRSRPDRQGPTLSPWTSRGVHSFHDSLAHNWRTVASFAFSGGRQRPGRRSRGTPVAATPGLRYAGPAASPSELPEDR